MAVTCGDCKKVLRDDAKYCIYCETKRNIKLLRILSITFIFVFLILASAMLIYGVSCIVDANKVGSLSTLSEYAKVSKTQTGVQAIACSIGLIVASIIIPVLIKWKALMLENFYYLNTK